MAAAWSYKLLTENTMTQHICPVCGYPELSEPAYNEDGFPSDDICVSCNYQFGYHDDDQFITHVQWREKWMAEGMPWSSSYLKPPKGWDPVKQLENIGVYIGSN
jgi:hypothetical protein